MTRTPAPSAPDAALTGTDVAIAAQLACLLEVSAPKPGNVSPGRHFRDARYEDFLASAVAIGPALAGAGTRGLGATVRLAIEATSRWTRSNTNLGIVLLLTPLARAALRRGPDCDAARGESRSTSGSPQSVDRLRHAVGAELAATTVEDAREVYAAIRLASPGGLGRADTQDVAEEPTIALLEAMRLAADRDAIAREYATAFEATFGTGVPALAAARRAGLSWDDAVVETFLTLLSARPDTHIARRSSDGLAATVTDRARAALAAGGVRSPAGRRAIDDMDCALRDSRNTANPGATADLTAAAIFVVVTLGGWTSIDGGTHERTR
jgi:triphosphoribosyl-dephospho-CoA synthase